MILYIYLSYILFCCFGGRFKVYIIFHRRLLPLTPFSSGFFQRLIFLIHRSRVVILILIFILSSIIFIPPIQSSLIIIIPTQHPPFQAHKNNSDSRPRTNERASKNKQKKNKSEKSCQNALLSDHGCRVVARRRKCKAIPSPSHCIKQAKESQQTNEATK